MKKIIRGFILPDERDGCALGKDCLLCRVPECCITEYAELGTFATLTQIIQIELLHLMFESGYGKSTIRTMTAAPADMVRMVYNDIKRAKRHAYQTKMELA